MRNFKLTLAYDGTDYHGWQIQPAQPTIQGTLTEILERLTQQPTVVCGAGRTDAGVHAVGQVAHFKTTSELSAEDFQRACNAMLPAAIRVVDVAEVPEDFHARWNAQAKTYCYRLHRGRVVSPFLWRYVHHDSSPLDFAAMQEAARLFEGEHDFTTFAASTGSEDDDQERETLRTIYSSQLRRVSTGLSGSGPVNKQINRPVAESEESAATLAGSTELAGSAEEEQWIYEVRGRSFLRYMVRKVVGTLVEVGRGRLQPASIPELFAARDRTRSGPTMPPQGLCLLRVEYGRREDE